MIAPSTASSITAITNYQTIIQLLAHNDHKPAFKSRIAPRSKIIAAQDFTRAIRRTDASLSSREVGGQKENPELKIE
jgi:hypothetical protein